MAQAVRWRVVLHLVTLCDQLDRVSFLVCRVHMWTYVMSSTIAAIQVAVTFFDKSTCSVTFFLMKCDHTQRTSKPYHLFANMHVSASPTNHSRVETIYPRHGSFLGPRNDLYCSTHGKSCSSCICTCSLSMHPIWMSIATRRTIYKKGDLSTSTISSRTI